MDLRNPHDIDCPSVLPFNLAFESRMVSTQYMAHDFTVLSASAPVASIYITSLYVKPFIFSFVE